MPQKVDSSLWCVRHSCSSDRRVAGGGQIAQPVTGFVSQSAQISQKIVAKMGIADEPLGFVEYHHKPASLGLFFDKIAQSGEITDRHSGFDTQTPAQRGVQVLEKLGLLAMRERLHIRLQYQQAGFLRQGHGDLVEQGGFANAPLAQQAGGLRFVRAEQAGADFLQNILAPEKYRRIGRQRVARVVGIFSPAQGAEASLRGLPALRLGIAELGLKGIHSASMKRQQ